MIEQLVHDELFEHACADEVLGVRGVVRPAVGDDPLEVGDEQALVAVVVRHQPLCHRPQVHRILDVVVIVWNYLPIDRIEEGPGGLVVLGRVQDGLEGVVEHVGIVWSSTPASFNRWGPAGLKNSCKDVNVAVSKGTI